ncbi:MAG: cytidylyltransferase domain-containing protein [Thermoanaerobaculia bacterium]
MKPKILAVVPARGGSKGVPRKNVRVVAGKPLIAYTIETALAAGDLFFDAVVSTDDPEIAEIARAFGASVPFLRPAELAGDRVATVPVLQHAVETMERFHGVTFEWVCLLQPTEPFRTVDDLVGAVRLAELGDCDSVISVVQVFAHHPILMKKIVDDRLQPYCVEEVEGTRRQDYFPPAYMRNGAIYLTKRLTLMEQNSIWGGSIRPLVMPPERSVSVDDERDLKLVEILMLERRGESSA